jgi:GNAT superfamily N-acetyltransferase
VVGTADVRVPSPEEALPSAYISNVCVDVDSRRLGVASMLLDKCFEVASAWGLKEVLPLIWISNDPNLPPHPLCMLSVYDDGSTVSVFAKVGARVEVRRFDAETGRA